MRKFSERYPKEVLEDIANSGRSTNVALDYVYTLWDEEHKISRSVFEVRGPMNIFLVIKLFPTSPEPVLSIKIWSRTSIAKVASYWTTTVMPGEPPKELERHLHYASDLFRLFNIRPIGNMPTARSDRSVGL